MALPDEVFDELPSPAWLLDEEYRPDFRTVYGRLAREAHQIDVAIRKIRLSGVSLGREELGAPSRIRVILAEIDILTMASEAESLAARPNGRWRLKLIIEMLETGTLDVRSAPLGGWAPDFSVFSGGELPWSTLVGPHWFERPYPHRGPALASVHHGEGARRLARRFHHLWEDAHDVRTPLVETLQDGLHRVPIPPDPSPLDSGSP